MRRFFLALVLTILSVELVQAEVCDYTPSNLVGDLGSATLAGGAGATAGAGFIANAAGLYTFTHAVTGATMVGSTLAGTSAAGTVGIIGGTAGTLFAAAVAVVTAPAVAIGAGIVAGGTVLFEGACYFLEEDVEPPNN